MHIHKSNEHAKKQHFQVSTFNLHIGYGPNLINWEKSKHVLLY
jgi:hypothetical protein